ncbi:MAG: transporter substrate-binding domain-containing protein [Chitinispirillales bacterium]|nr:transporter substrate-binding domain-containing protein [Chitinispirillales bacterium]
MKAPVMCTLLTAAVAMSVALAGVGCGKDSGKQDSAGAKDAAGKTAVGPKWANGAYDKDEFADKTLAILDGSTFDAVARDKVGAKLYKYYDSRGKCMDAILAGEADGMLVEEPVARKFAAQHPDSLIVLYPKVDREDYANLFCKKDKGKMRDEFNAFLKEITASGIYKEMVQRWVDTPDSPPMPEITLSPTKKKLVFATSDCDLPFSFKDGSGAIVGFDIEMAMRFAQANGYGIEVKVMAFPDIIPAVSAGMIDFAANLIAITEERKGVVDFSEPVYFGGTVMLARK